MAERLPTIYDVARTAGVSPATVSRVLNEPSRVQNEKREKVMDAIGELHFVPKADAVAKARRQYKKIGVIAPFFTEPSFMQRLRGIASVLSGRHYELVLYVIESISELEAYIDMLVSSRRVDGLIVLCLQLGDASVGKLARLGLPVCFVESDVSGFDCVIVKNEAGGRMAAEYLYSCGFRRPGFVGEVSLRPYAVPATELRLSGYEAFFAERGIPLDERFVCVSEFAGGKLDAEILRILKQKERPDCVFTSSDVIAARFLKAAASVGLSVPQDIAVVGFDDLEMAELIALSTVSQSLDESGRLAAEMVLDRIKDGARAPRCVFIPLSVKERETAKRGS